MLVLEIEGMGERWGGGIRDGVRNVVLTIKMTKNGEPLNMHVCFAIPRSAERTFMSFWNRLCL